MNETILPNWLKQRAALSPNRVAMIMNNTSLTFQELYDSALEYASRLQAQGIRKGDSVGILMNNRLELVITLHALMQIGAEIVLHNIRLTAEELSWQFQDAGLTYLITEAKYKEKVQKTHSHSATVLLVEQIPTMLLSTDTVYIDEFDLNKTATIMYTSGTTGNPKGVMQTYGNHWWSATGSMLNLGLHEDDKWLCAVPMFHISGLSILMRSVIYGMTVVGFDQFDEAAANQAIKEQGVTIMSVVTTMLNRMLNQLGDDSYPASFRCMLLGGGPAPLSLLEVCKEKSIPIFQTYGMTETASQIVTLSPEDSIRKLGSAGKPLFPAQLAIHEEGCSVNPMQIGEIVVKGPNVTKGYAHRPDATADAFDQGWFKTGDLGYVDEEGFLYVVDRRSDLLISGGENIYPAEIENILMKHEAVFEAGVTGVEDERWGQIPIGFVVLHKDVAVSTEQLLAHCSTYLASYKVPKKIVFVDELPRNASNKLVRRSLKEMMKE